MTQTFKTVSNNKTAAAKTKKGGTVKHLLSTAALCVALYGAPAASASAPATVTQSAPVEVTLQDAYGKLIADAKAQMMRDPQNALEHAVNAESLVRSATSFADRDTAIATAMWLRGAALVRSGKPEEGASVIQNALDLIGEEGAKTKLGGDLLLAQGRVASRASDVKTAVKSFFKAHDVFVALDEPRSEAIALQSIGSIYRDAQAYPRALEFYARASEVYSGDASLDLSSFNNQANVLKEMGRLDEARKLFGKAFDIADEMESDVLKARILTNMADLEILNANYLKAEDLAAQALDLLEGDEGTEWARFVYGSEAHAKLKQGKVAEAASLIEKAFDGLAVADTSMSYEEMHDVAYQVYLMQGDYAMALEHHQSFKRLSDNAKKVASSANLALMGAKFRSAEQQLNIERLKNEQLNKDVALENANRQMTIQVAIMALGALIILFSFLSLIALRNHRNRIARVNEQLQTTVDQLNKEIERREVVERDLVVAKDKAEEANRMKSTFLATMSHELRTPMNGILGFSRILLDSDLSDEQREHVGIIEQSGDALLGLINDILDLSQMEAGKLKLTEGAFNLRTTVEDAVKLLQPKAQEKGLDLAVQIDPALPAMVNGDADRIRQIVVNLAGNAVKFTENGSVAVMVAAGEGEDAIKLSVIDTGIGIADDKVGILFNRFQQADGSTTRKYGGSGLGLAICKELVEAMNGEIGVNTVLGAGSEFWMSVPLAAADDLTVLPRTETTLAEPKRIIVVDNVEVNQKVFAEMLPAMNAQPVIAASGADAIETLATLKASGEPVDAVIVNAKLDDIAADELVKRLDRNALLGDASLILSGAAPMSMADLTDMGFEGQINQLMLQDAVFDAVNATTAGDVEADMEEEAVAHSAEVISFQRPVVSGRVLLVEDNPANQSFITAVMDEFDVEMDIVRNGVEAVEAAAEKAYDLILMDVHMPNMNGVEATRRIRRIDTPNSETPIVALTAKALPGDREKFLQAGMSDYLSKPLELAPLRSKVKSVLERRKPRRGEESGEVVALDA